MPNISIHMLTADFVSTHFLLWRCLHDGPLNRETIDAWKPGSTMPWAALRERNTPLLRKLIEVYGACAVVALDDLTDTGIGPAERSAVVGQLRFYPKNIWRMAGGGMLCMQQFPPDGPGEDFVANAFPPQEQLVEKTLVIHCLMTGCPALTENPYQRRGIGTRMVNKLIEWAGQNGWEAIEATAYAELDVLYQVTGQAGIHFWEKIGTSSRRFQVVETGVEEGFFQAGGFFRAMQAEAAARGLDPNTITQKFTMRMVLS